VFQGYSELKLFDWNNRQQCQIRAERYAGEVLSEEAGELLHKNPPDGCFGDNLDWFPFDDARPLVASGFASEYSHIRAFHCCRPQSYKTYNELGLLAQRPDIPVQRFKEIFSDIDSTILQAVVDEYQVETFDESGKLFFNTSDTYLLEECGHYALFGSEYLIALAARLSEKVSGFEDFRYRLLDHGVPTVIEAAVPVSDISEAQLNEISGMIIAAWSASIINDSYYSHESISCVLDRDLEREEILDHYHPQWISDPYRFRKVVQNLRLQCDGC